MYENELDISFDLRAPLILSGVSETVSTGSVFAPIRPTRIGPYIVGKTLGEGSYGTVMLASYDRACVTVAIKVSTPAKCTDMMHEVAAYAAIHANRSLWVGSASTPFPFLDLFAHDFDSPLPWMSLEYFPGQILHLFLGKLSGCEFVSTAVQMVQGGEGFCIIETLCTWT